MPLPFDQPEFSPGSVWLVGAGPGDPGLLTVHGLTALGQADAVVHDALVDPRIVALARADAQVEAQGKRGGRPSPRQAVVTARLIELARQGLRVVRLKGGDPFIFGRGAEEVAGLHQAGIPVWVVPGVTAGIGGLAAAAIPATDAQNSAITLITGHDPSGATPDQLDWTALAQGAPVLVIYMALGHLRALVGRLLAGGRRASEPVALVSRATTPHQRVLVSCLGECADAAKQQEIAAPALLVVGPVVDLRPLILAATAQIRHSQAHLTGENMPEERGDGSAD